MQETDTKLLTGAEGGFILKGWFQDQAVIGRGDTPEAAKLDFTRTLGIIERSWLRWLEIERAANAD